MWFVSWTTNELLERVVEMYISEFWCGVGATLICELAMLICYAVYFDKKRSRKKK